MVELPTSANRPPNHAARSRTYFHSLLHSRLDALLATAAPTQTVVLAMDGPAPLAKLLEQR